MVIPDAESPGPVKKRPRLSLKVHKNDESKGDIKPEKQESVAGEEGEEVQEVSREVVLDDSVKDSNHKSVVPVSASLENLGNTCFLNSVLQVLRFTPGFLPGLELLYQEIVQVEKLRKQGVLNKEDAGVFDPLETNKSIHLVKDLYRLYKNMEQREENHEDVATSDVMSMAVKPQKLLNIIRELNPMFEGYLQHDAQELLRCILSYLQDSEKDLFSMKKNVSEKLPKNDTPKNSIMDRFLSRCTRVKPENGPKNVFHQPDILDQIEQSEAAKTSVTQHTTPVEADTACRVQKEVLKTENVSIPKLRTRTPRGKQTNKEHKSTQNTEKTNPIRKQGTPRPEKALDEPDGTMTSVTNELEDKRENIKNGKASVSDTKDESMEISSNRTENKSVHCKMNGELGKNEKNGLQQTILGMFQSQRTGKRLGMSRAVLRNSSGIKSDGNAQVNGESEGKLSEAKRKSVPCVEKSVSGSPSKNQSSPIQPVVKLEKCDKVCNSPLKSVSAQLATEKLSPSKSVMSPSRDGPKRAKQRLDFVVIPKNKVKGNVNLKATKTNFIEDLFMGKMMLRTKCCECENCRERIEDFHDISVPVRSEKTEESDEEEEEEQEEDSDSCLRKLMFAFTEVERLCDDNKYFCDTCLSHVEAERSLHYQVLPNILTLHLKRFSTSSGMFGCVSKINDHVSIPLSLPCLRYKCPSPCSRPDHRYLLYAIITHAGVTLTSGHYLSYVHVPTEQNMTDGFSGHFLSTTSQQYPGHWLECDDETSRVYDQEKFSRMLKGDDRSLMGTPYVLFYYRNTPVSTWTPR